MSEKNYNSGAVYAMDEGMRTSLSKGLKYAEKAFFFLCAAAFLSACAAPPPTMRQVIQPTNTTRFTAVPAVPTLAPPTATVPPPTPQSPFAPAIVFESNRSGRYEIYGMNRAGGDLTMITRPDTDADGSGSPDWSPDGSRIAFSSRRDNDWDLFVLGGDSDTNVTQTLGDDDKADWSPDGTRILFASIRGDQRWADIFVMDADGSSVRNLTANGDDDREPAWSPNGTEIVYRSFRDGNYELYLMDVESRAPRQLTRTESPVWNASADWSPDGHWIAFETNRDGNWEIYVTDNNGANVRNLTNNAADDKDVSWSPDGTQIIFSSNRDGNFEIYTLNLTTQVISRLTYDCGRDHNPDWRANAPGDTDTPAEQHSLATVTSDLNLRASPSAAAEAVGSAAAGDCFNVRARSSDNQWLQVKTSARNIAWVARSLVDLQGNVDAIPVSS